MPAHDNNDTSLSPQIVGNAGLYYVCHHLSLLGWNCMPTSRNARGVDLICYNADCSRMVGVQVKSLSKRNPVPLGKSLDKVMGDYWVIVNNLQANPVAYVMLPGEVKDLAHRGKKNGVVSFWLQPAAYDTDAFRNAWHRFDAVTDDLSMYISEFFGAETVNNIEFLRRHQAVLRDYLHGLLTLRPAPRKTLLQIAADPASIPGWLQSLKENPTHGLILGEFLTRLVRHHEYVVEAGRRLAGEYGPSAVDRNQGLPSTRPRTRKR